MGFGDKVPEQVWAEAQRFLYDPAGVLNSRQ